MFSRQLELSEKLLAVSMQGLFYFDDRLMQFMSLNALCSVGSGSILQQFDNANLVVSDKISNV